jgi:gas vesicle protein
MKKNRQEYEYLAEGTSRVKPVLSGLLLGGLIGAGTALLFAPQAGEQTRAAIQNKTMELRDRTTEGVKGAVSQVTTKTRQVASDVLHKGQRLVHRGTEALDEGLDDATETVERRSAVRSY